MKNKILKIEFFDPILSVERLFWPAVEHSPLHPKIKGSNPPAATGIKWRKRGTFQVYCAGDNLSAILFLWPQEDLNP